MKKLESFVQEINEGRPKGSTNKKKSAAEVKAEYKDIEDVEGKPVEKAGTQGLWAVDEPKDDSAYEPLDKATMDMNTKRLLAKFKAEEPFFVLGRAGWGKTSIIVDMAGRFKYRVITVYLDKAVSTDLEGTPVPIKTKSGGATQLLLPAWAKIIEDNPDDNFLLFFDEMNQAEGQVMNALMPIVLRKVIAGRKFENFFVGAAGNFKSENDCVEELSGPLEDRFSPIINWETHTPKAWASAFKHLRKEWESKLCKEVVDRFEATANLFDNPRRIEHKIFQFMYKLKCNSGYEYFDADFYYDRLKTLANDDLERSDDIQLKELADMMNDYMNNDLKSQKAGRGERSRENDMVPANIKKAIRMGMKYGYVEDKEGNKWGVSRENIYTVVEDDMCNAEMIERLITKYEAEGIKFKFEKNSEWKKAGYKDPE